MIMQITEKSTLIAKQSGVVMVVCLVLLLVVTALGLTSMNSTTLETKMASGFRDRAVAFEAAEEALSVAETWILDTDFSETDFYNACTGSLCFSSSCSNGLCVFYDSADPYVNGVDKADCSGKMDEPTTPPWQWAGVSGEPNLWLSSTDSVEVSTSHPDVETDARYIVEFVCYVNRIQGTDCTATNPDACAPNFRISALGRGLTDNSMVMLQSTFKKVN